MHNIILEPGDIITMKLYDGTVLSKVVLIRLSDDEMLVSYLNKCIELPVSSISRLIMCRPVCYRSFINKHLEKIEFNDGSILKDVIIKDAVDNLLELSNSIIESLIVDLDMIIDITFKEDYDV